ncbi:50S ribosomal protein L11 methyltransferase [Hyphomicrobium sp. DY-1]|uniref:50S ribosomal protein L11 methyltransferase n=1 Tax=Hyphomicrobium sp. DY-1 TaxID=3075650 RepID=UPI0039C0C2FE
MRIEYHRTLIADRVRNEAFFAALKAGIIPGKSVVADIGAGTGLLGLMASKLGAKEVFLFETAEVAGVAAAVLKANKAKRCHLIPCHSTEFQDRLAVDIVVSETLGNYALEENIIATLADARQRFLKPGGTVIPDHIIQYVAPVVTPRIDAELRAWDRVGHGLDLSVAQTMSLNNAYVRALQPAEILDGCRSAMVWDEVDLTTETKSKRRGEAEWRLPRPAKIYGFATWWKVELVPGIGFSTGPLSPRTHWEQLYFPLSAPMDADASDLIAIDLRSSSSEEAGTHLAWTAIHKNAGGKVLARQSHDLDKGYLP